MPILRRILILVLAVLVLGAGVGLVMGQYIKRWSSARTAQTKPTPSSRPARLDIRPIEEEAPATASLPLEAALVLRLPLHRHLVPYVGGGAGYYFKDAEYEDDTETWESSEEVAGYFGLAGLNLYLGAVSLFAEAKYNLIGTDDDLEWRGSDVEAQNSLDGFSFSAGLKLGF